jgi:hypothetical protein
MNNPRSGGASALKDMAAAMGSMAQRYLIFIVTFGTNFYYTAQKWTRCSSR